MRLVVFRFAMGLKVLLYAVYEVDGRIVVGLEVDGLVRLRGVVVFARRVSIGAEGAISDKHSFKDIYI